MPLKLNTPLLASSILFVLLLAGCSSFYSHKSPEITALVGPLSDAVENGKHPRRLIAPSEKPTYFGQSLNISSLNNIRIIDTELEFKFENGLPLYRVLLTPRKNISPQQWQSLPSTLNILARVPVNKQVLYFSTKLPEERNFGNTHTPWTYCGECFSYNETTQTYFNIDTKIQLDALINDKNLGFNLLLIEFVDTPKTAFYVDEALENVITKAKETQLQIAREEAQKAEALRLEQLRIEEENRLYAPARNAYQELSKKVVEESLQQARLKACGKLIYTSLPNPRYASPEDINRAGLNSKDTFSKHYSCVNEFLSALAPSEWGPHLHSMVEIESSLWPQTNLDDNKRVEALSLNDAFDSEKQYLASLELGYQKRISSIESLWDDFEFYEKKRWEKERENKIQAEVKRCLYTLASRNALTEFSNGYCRTQAEKGISGVQAGYIGSAGASRPDKSALLYQRKELPEFNLQGMIENARAVSEGASPSVLWDESGAIRTTQAPELNNRSAAGLPKMSARKSGQSSQASRESLDIQSNETEEIAYIENESTDEQTTNANSANEAKDEWPDRFMLTYVEDTGMIDGAIQLFSYKKVDSALVNDEVIAVKLEPFVTSNKACDASGKVPAELRFVVQSYWNGPTREQVQALQQAIRGNPFVAISPAGVNNNDFRNVMDAVGTTYKGQGVHWQNPAPFRQSLYGTGCKTVVWNNGFESKIPIRSP